MRRAQGTPLGDGARCWFFRRSWCWRARGTAARGRDGSGCGRGGGVPSTASEREGRGPPPGLAPRGQAVGVAHLCPDRDHVAGPGGQRSVTLFSSAAATCCRRKANCIFWAAGSSSRALMICGGGSCQARVGRGPLGSAPREGGAAYLVIVLLRVLVELVQGHQGVQGVRVRLRRGQRDPGQGRAGSRPPAERAAGCDGGRRRTQRHSLIVHSRGMGQPRPGAAPHPRRCVADVAGLQLPAPQVHAWPRTGPGPTGLAPCLSPGGRTPLALKCLCCGREVPLTREISAKCVFMSWSLTCTICRIPL